MSVFDLLLIALMLGTMVAVPIALVCALRRRWSPMKRVLGYLGAAWILYLAIGTVVAVATPQRVQGVGQQRCYDEMCYTVIASRQADAIPTSSSNLVANGVFHVITVEVASKSRGRAQREKGAEATLIDAQGHRYYASASVGAALASEGKLSTLDTLVEPGESKQVELVYDVPRAAGPLGWSLGRSFALNPARLVVGDDMHFFHKPTITPVR